MRSRLAVILLVALLAFPLVTACNQHHSSARTAGSAMLNVRLMDAPIDLSNVQSVMVTLTGVIVYPDDGEATMQVPTPGEEMEKTGADAPITLLNHPATFDLLTLTGGASMLLASGEVPAGEYSRIRLEISDATLVYKDGSSVSLKIESNKVDIPIEFKLTVNADKTLTLDFNAAASVQVDATGSGIFILRPVVTPSMSD